MLNKILVFGGWALILILVFSSMATWWTRVPFLWMDISVWLLIIYTSVIWMFMWYWIKNMFKKDGWDDENYDF